MFMLMMNMMEAVGVRRQVDAVIFDFGGVLAEEGFFDGFTELARTHGMDPGGVTEIAVDVARKGGYVVGRTTEAEFWEAFRQQTGIHGSDEFLRNEILSRFIPRRWMFDLVDKLRNAGYKVAILSDQTNWLEELDAKYDIYSHFDLVWNSWRLGSSKKEPELFDRVVAELGVDPARSLFVDDYDGHIGRAEARGLKAIHYTNQVSFLRQFKKYCPL